MSKIELITIARSTTHGDFEHIIHSDNLDRFLDPGAPYADDSDELKQLKARRRRELAGFLRALARALELGENPFGLYGDPDPLEMRGSAEAEMDALGEHIARLEKCAKAVALPVTLPTEQDRTRPP